MPPGIEKQAETHRPATFLNWLLGSNSPVSLSSRQCRGVRGLSPLPLHTPTTLAAPQRLQHLCVGNTTALALHWQHHSVRVAALALATLLAIAAPQHWQHHSACNTAELAALLRLHCTGSTTAVASSPLHLQNYLQSRHNNALAMRWQHHSARITAFARGKVQAPYEGSCAARSRNGAT